MAEIKTSSPAPAFQSDAPPQTPSEQFLEKHFRSIMVGLVVLAVVLLAGGVMRYRANQTAQEAAEHYTSASSPEDCDVVVQKYPGSVAAGNAVLRKAELLWADGKKESSIGALRQFIKDYGTHPLQAQAQLGLGSKLAAMGEKAEARQIFDGVLKKYPQSEFAPAAQIQIGDLLWQEGKTDEAKKLFESLLRLYPGKMAALNDGVTRRLELMNAGLPTTEIAAPPAPKPVTPPHPALPAVGAAPLPHAMAPPQINAPPLVPPPAAPAPAPAAKLPTPPAPVPATPAPALPTPNAKAPTPPAPPVSAPAPAATNSLPIPPPPPVKPKA